MKSITSDTEILINDGWCKIQDYNNKNKIAVLNYDENNSIEFITIDNITTINEDYLYLINSEDFDFSQAIGRNTITNVNLINQQITNIKYNKNDYVICSGFKQNGNSHLTNLDKLLTLINISHGIINKTNEEISFGFTTLAKGIDTKIINIAKELNLKIIYHNYGNYSIELIANSDLIKNIDINNLNWIKLENINHNWAKEFIILLVDLTTPFMLKKEKISEYKSNNREEISKIQALCVLCGLNSKFIYDYKKKKKYKLEIVDNILKRCNNIKKIIIPYDNLLYNINIKNQGLIIKYGDITSII